MSTARNPPPNQVTRMMLPLTVSCGWCAPYQHSGSNGLSCGTAQVEIGTGCASSVMSTIHIKALGDGVSRSETSSSVTTAILRPINSCGIGSTVWVGHG